MKIRKAKNNYQKGFLFSIFSGFVQIYLKKLLIFQEFKVT
jgi:hypothetical protein